MAIGDRLAPEVVGAYRIERELGHGGMGVVYSGVHQLLGRRAAVKVLLPDLSRKQDLVQRFFNEAKAATAIKHPSIVEIYDFGYSDDGSAYIVMELLDGETLAHRMKAGPIEIPTAVGLARQVANALAAAHKVGIVHRDLKPDNVYLIPDPEVPGGERVKLLDFGIAKLASDTMGPARTVTGAILGTPHYMSPEQCEGSRVVDHRTDLYSLGCLLFQMITGRLPFESEGIGGLIGMHLYVAPPTLRSRKPSASVALDDVVAKLLAKPVEERYQTALAVAAALNGPEVIEVSGDAGTRTVPGSGAIAMAATIATPADGDEIAMAQTMATDADRVNERAKTELDTRRDSMEGDPPPTRVEPQARPKRTMVMIIAVMVVGAAGAVAFVGVRGRGGNDGDTRNVHPTIDAAIAVISPPPPDAMEPVQTQTIIEIDEDPQDAVIDDLAAMEAARIQKRFDDVAALHKKIVAATADEPDGPLREKADAAFVATRRLALVEIARKVDRLAKQGECMKLGVEVRRAEELWGKAATKRFAKQADACSKGTRDRGDVSVGDGSVDPVGSGSGSGAGSGAPSQSEIVAIQRAVQTGNYKVALGTCLKVRPKFATDVRLWQVCLLAACQSHNAGLARGFVELGKRPVPASLKQRCAATGIDFDQGEPGPSNKPAKPITPPAKGSTDAAGTSAGSGSATRPPPAPHRITTD